MDKQKTNKKQNEQVIDNEMNESEVQKLTERVTSLEDQLKRAVADYHNLEKRVSEGRSELTAWGATELISKLLPVMDHLFQAIEGAQKAGENSGWLQGVRLAALQMKKALEESGLEIISPEPMSNFDPVLHEAVDVVEGEDGKIVNVTEMGYKMNGKIIKPARVVVGKRPSKVSNVAPPWNTGPEDEKGEK